MTPTTTDQSSDISLPSTTGSTWEENSFIKRSLETLGQYHPEKKPKPVAIEIVRHPQAPLFDSDEWPLILQHAASEVVSANALSEEMREVIRQAGFVSLWFFGKLIAGQEGPFNLLTDHLHVSMSNFRQRLLYPGCRGASVVSRGCYKSTINTELGSMWELLRNPDLRIRITSSSDEKAEGFFLSVKEYFESNVNELFYPETYVSTSRRSKYWNNSKIVLPNRTRRYREPSVEFGGIGAKSAGRHYDLHIVDDPVEFTDLNSGRLSSTDMYKATNWFWASEKSLLVSMQESRLILSGTRYAADDLVSTIIPKVRAFYGYPMDGASENPKGTWILYYRKSIEDGMIVFPETKTYEGLMEMAETDWWAFATQELNDPQNTGIAEFSEYEVGDAVFQYIESADEWYVQLPAYDERNPRRYAFSDCDVVQASDPAATEKYVSSKTSRSANGILITTPNLEYIFYNVRAGYVGALDLIDMMFDNMDRYGQWIRSSLLEEQGAFRMLHGIIEREENLRKKWISLAPVTATGDKDASIRSVLQPELAKGKIYADSRSKDIIMEEVRSFPASRKKDVLDMMKLAIRASMRPLTEEDIEAEEAQEEAWRNRRHSVAGYG